MLKSTVNLEVVKKSAFPGRPAGPLWRWLLCRLARFVVNNIKLNLAFFLCLMEENERLQYLIDEIEVPIVDSRNHAWKKLNLFFSFWCSKLPIPAPLIFHYFLKTFLLFFHLSFLFPFPPFFLIFLPLFHFYPQFFHNLFFSGEFEIL